MALLSKEQILAAQDLTTETVKVPEWGGEVLVKALSGRERDAYDASIYDQRKGKMHINRHNLRARFCAMAMVDEQGKRLFSDAEVEALGAKSAGALERVYDAAAKLAGLTKEDEDELLGESESGQSEDSGSD
jgi:hypothetical protein